LKAAGTDFFFSAAKASGVVLYVTPLLSTVSPLRQNAPWSMSSAPNMAPLAKAVFWAALVPSPDNCDSASGVPVISRLV
jgi:hypothetical protein